MSDSVDIEFQVLDWNYYHEIDTSYDPPEEDDGTGENYDQEGNIIYPKIYKIRIFGRTRDDKTIYVRVDGFKPYFFFKMQEKWTKGSVDQIISTAKTRAWPPHLRKGLIDYKIVDKYDFYGFTNYEKFKYVQLIFQDYESFRSYERLFRKGFAVYNLQKSKKIKFDLYESNIDPILRCMHTQKLDALGWIKVNKYNTISKSDPHISISEINISTDYRNLTRIEDMKIQQYVIASFDIECTSSVEGSFPKPEREDDNIIQIGTVFARLGEKECFYKHIVTLGTCNQIEGVDVEYYHDEKEMMMAWVKMLRKMNPDIITGYNILGFDFKYMKERAEKLGISSSFSKLSRIKSENSVWKEQKLASSALGENKLEYYEMTGRVIIDLMKVAQRDHKLDSYKLDAVSANFIKQDVKEMIYDSDKNQTIIKTPSTYGVKVDQYITINYNDGITNNKHMDGTKFKIVNLEPDKLHVEGKIEKDILEQKVKVFWSQAKDDIHHTDIFRLQKGTSKDRAIIAKYCIQDCELVIKLMAKLQVLINNIGMANVCHVPLSYLFMRGQGVKIFSLVSRQCRELEHLIPVIKKKELEKNKDANKLDAKQVEEMEKIIGKKSFNKDDEDDSDDEDNSFEGAIVFDPVSGVHFEPIPVLDYNSLYPNSMIQRNTSHECCVDEDQDDEYGYLEGYKYHEIQYNTTYTIENLKKEKVQDILEFAVKQFSSKLNIIYRDHETENIVTHEIIETGDVKKVNIEITKAGLTNEKTERFAFDEEDKPFQANNKLKKIILNNSKNILIIFRLIYKNIRRFLKKLLNQDVSCEISPDKKIFRFYRTIFRKRQLWIELDATPKEEKIIKYTICKFAEKETGEKGIIPNILIGLLDARKKYKNIMEGETDPAMKSVWDGLQLAYKVTANSLYGQTGAPTSPIYKKEIAASTTATGREMLKYSRYFIEGHFNNLINCILLDTKEKYLELCNQVFDILPHKVYDKNYGIEINIGVDVGKKIPDKKFSVPDMGYTNKAEFFETFYNKIKEILTGYYVNMKIIYGDTDSVFFNPKITDCETKKILKDKKALEICIQLGIWASECICKVLPAPQKQAYEKVLWPFAILTKKRYVGNLYETNPNKCYQKSMGIVLKRRDNAAIVKIMCGGIIDQILNKHSAEGAIEFTKKTLKDILANKFPLDKFIITKTLKARDSYKDWKRIVHAVLAERMAERDPGNRPMPNDRIPYVYFKLPEGAKEPELQGDRVEHIDYFTENKMQLDFLFYITNQIMVPAIQFLEMVAENPKDIFDDFIRREENFRKGIKPVTYYFGKLVQEQEEKHKNGDKNGEKDEELDSESSGFDPERDNTQLAIKKDKTKKTSKITKQNRPSKKPVKLTEKEFDGFVLE